MLHVCFASLLCFMGPRIRRPRSTGW